MDFFEYHTGVNIGVKLKQYIFCEIHFLDTKSPKLGLKIQSINILYDL